MKSQLTLYAYVDGSDLKGVEAELEPALTRFVQSREWHFRRARVVNQRHEHDPTLRPGDLPDWDLGLNLEVPMVQDHRFDWLADIEDIAKFLRRLHTKTGCEFVVGVADSETGVSEDLFYVSTNVPERDKLLAIMRRWLDAG
nr:putative uncharacterized protein [uncultured bacterium]